MIPSYRFEIVIDSHKLGFQEISGIQRECEVEPILEGGRNTTCVIVPKATSKSQVLTLKKGVLLQGSSPFYMIGEAIDSLDIKVFDYDGKTLIKMYTLKNLITLGWVVSALDAQKSGILIDTFTVAYGELYAIT